MGGFVGRLRALALTLGAPGLFLIAFLDSSFLSLPEIADILVVYMVTRNKSRMLIYVAATLLGSLAGCLVMYYIGRKGGDALVRKRFATGNVERAMVAFQRHGIMAVLVPSILPPPAPFKIFVLLAGVAGISPGQFTIAVIIGRGARYLLLGILAVEYGEPALQYMNEHAVAVTAVALGLLGGGFAAYLLWSKAAAAKRR
jgi:membrane protein YqaA with SNARE-associated domain